MCKLGGHVLLFCISFGLHLLIIQVIISGPLQPIKGGANLTYFKIEQSIVMLPNLSHTLLLAQNLSFNLTPSPSKGLAKPPQFPTLMHLQGTHTSQEGLASSPPQAFASFISKTQRRAQRNAIIWYQSYGSSKMSISLHFSFCVFLISKFFIFIPSCLAVFLF